MSTEFWDARRGTIRSRIGGARIGEGIVFTHGYSILDQLVGKVSFFQGLILNVTGRLPEERLGRWMEATFLCLSWPDPRIWCNGVGTFAGTLQTSPVAAVTAGVLASDAHMYGPYTMFLAAETLEEGGMLNAAGWPTEAIVRKLNRWPQRTIPTIPGYSRPIAYGDERVPVMDAVATEMGFQRGPHLALAYEISTWLQEQHRESINLAGYMSAFLLDHGLTKDQIYRLYALCVNGGIHACYGEARDNPPESFLPLRCEDIDYQGRPYRPVP